MSRVTQKDMDWLPQPSFQIEGKKSTQKWSSGKSLKKSFPKIILGISAAFALLILPFFVLIRTAVYMNVEQNINGWVSILVGASGSILFLVICFGIVLRKTKHRKVWLKLIFSGISMFLLGFCLSAVLYLSSVNSKTEGVREVYRSLHPILRLSVATVTLADKNLVITDIRRQSEDYAKMGLSQVQASYHFVQKDGYVHAIDLRTIGHSFIRNLILKQSLNVMGLQTIRHTGTADHLHVYLPVIKY